MGEPGVLGQIVARKRVDVARRMSDMTLDKVRGGAAPTCRSLQRALAKPGARFIFEVKRASPSAGPLRQSVDVAAIARAYRPVADAISVLTDEPFFGGSMSDLAAVRAEFDGPILAKDFIVDPRQVPEARIHGADAVLVILSVLADAEAAAVMAEARRLAMDVIVEVHDAGEIRRAVALGAGIIGINNRDLKTLATDLSVTEKLADMVPADVLLVSESGVRSRADVERLAPRVDAFLVGSSLMSSSDVGEAARALVHGRTKLCSLTQPEDIALAAHAGATHAGFIMVPESPRFVSPIEARPLADAARDLGLKTVGVFRDAPVGEVVGAADRLGLDAVQLHGSEPDPELLDIRRSLPDETELWALCAVNGSAAPSRAGADRSLFDTVQGGTSGGTGVPFDWSLVASRTDLPCAFLAGGISAANADAASRVGAFGLDVGSGVECRPGIKDPAKVEALFAALRPQARRAA